MEKIKKEKDKAKEIEASVNAAIQEGATGSIVGAESVALSKPYEDILPASYCSNTCSPKTNRKFHVQFIPKQN